MHIHAYYTYMHTTHMHAHAHHTQVQINAYTHTIHVKKSHLWKKDLCELMFRRVESIWQRGRSQQGTRDWGSSHHCIAESRERAEGQGYPLATHFWQEAPSTMDFCNLPKQTQPLKSVCLNTWAWGGVHLCLSHALCFVFWGCGVFQMLYKVQYET